MCIFRTTFWTCKPLENTCWSINKPDITLLLNRLLRPHWGAWVLNTSKICIRKSQQWGADGPGKAGRPRPFYAFVLLLHCYTCYTSCYTLVCFSGASRCLLFSCPFAPWLQETQGLRLTKDICDPWPWIWREIAGARRWPRDGRLLFTSSLFLKRPPRHQKHVIFGFSAKRSLRFSFKKTKASQKICSTSHIWNTSLSAKCFFENVNSTRTVFSLHSTRNAKS